MKRRANGEGTEIKERADGRGWYSAQTINGRQRQFTGRTRAEVAAKIRQAQSKLEQGIYTEPARVTLEAHFWRWLASLEANGRAKSTTDNYRRLLRVHVMPVLGSFRIQTITPAHVLDWQTQTLKAGKGAYLVKRCRIYLSACMNAAARLGLIRVNPVTAVESITAPRPTTDAYTPEEAAKVLQAALRLKSRLYPVIALGMSTGMRTGEILGLTWTALNAKTKTLTISQGISNDGGRRIIRETKTPDSDRVLEVGPKTIKLLEAQKLELARMKAQAGREWVEHGLIFPSRRGTPYAKKTLYRQWDEIVKAAQVRRLTPYEATRHTFATTAEASGVPVVIYSRMMGHKDISTAQNRYVHPNLEARRNVALRAEDWFNPEKEPKKSKPKPTKKPKPKKPKPL